MNLVVLDGYTLNPGDLSWKELQKLANCTIFDRTPPSKIAERCIGADIVLTNKTQLASNLLAKLPKLRYIGVLATGVNIVDLNAASEQGIVVTNAPSYSTDSVVQHTLGLILQTNLKLAEHGASVRAGRWSEQDDFCYTLGTINELAGRKLGILGYGQIGQKMAKIGIGLGMEVLVCTRKPGNEDGVKFVNVETLFSHSDYLSLHASLRKDNEGIVNRETLTQMKPHSVLVNTSRGDLVVESDLVMALQQKTIRAAALDVLSIEPPPKDHPLLHLDNCFVTPHIAWAARESRQRLMDITILNIKAFMANRPENVVN